MAGGVPKARGDVSLEPPPRLWSDAFDHVLGMTVLPGARTCARLRLRTQYGGEMDGSPPKRLVETHAVELLLAHYESPDPTDTDFLKVTMVASS